MRKKFEVQYALGQETIADLKVNTKCRDAFGKMVLALQKIFVTPEYNSKIFQILEDAIVKDKKKTGRKGMDLWQIFVLGQTRLCMNISKDRLHHMANHDEMLRQILGIAVGFGAIRIEFEYQNIVDNLDLLDEDLLKKLNVAIVEFGHDVFKKKETDPLHLKTDSFVVESNVHFPTDYNLLWDSARKIIDTLKKLKEEHPEITGLRNLNYRYKILKNGSRTIGQSSKKPEEVKKQVVSHYLEKAKLFSQKISELRPDLPMLTPKDYALLVSLEYFMKMLDKHIDLLERRVIKGETIPHHEKMFSIFETYTQWITKGKSRPSFELGKNIQVTTDQFHLIIDHEVMENITDKETITATADRILAIYKVMGWSFDKGFYTKDNKELLGLFVENLVMPKKGKLNKNETEEENQPKFKKARNMHSAVESNINALEHRGLDRCPDRSIKHFKRYIALGVCAYNLHRIGSELMKQAKEQSIKIAA